MHGTSIAPLAGPQNSRLAVWTGLFWVFSYLVLSARAHLLAIDSVWLSDVRIVSITVGTLLFGAALQSIDRYAAQVRHPLLFVGAALPAASIVLATRVLMDQLFSESPLSLTEHARWVLVWAGYFGVGLCTYLLVRTPHIAAGRTAGAQAPAAHPGAGVDTRARSGEIADPSGWEAVVDALAAEMLADNATRKADIMQRLLDRVGYELADDLGTPPRHNVRVRRAMRLIARLTEKASDRRS